MHVFSVKPAVILYEEFHVVLEFIINPKEHSILSHPGTGNPQRLYCHQFSDILYIFAAILDFMQIDTCCWT